MGLFKSKRERRIDREVEIRKGINLIKRQIGELERNERSYLVKAKRAKQLGAADQLGFLKKTIQRTGSQRRLMERQLLSIETAYQMKNQAEAHAQFARSMTAISRSISEMFGAADLERTQKEFETALAKAETLEERMELFLDLTSRSLAGGEPSEPLVSEAEIDRLIDGQIAEEESGKIDEEIQSGLAEIRKEIGRE